MARQAANSDPTSQTAATTTTRETWGVDSDFSWLNLYDLLIIAFDEFDYRLSVRSSYLHF